MTSISIICEQISTRASNISKLSSEMHHLVTNAEPKTAEFLDNVLMDDLEQVQQLVIALGDLVIPPTAKEKEGETSA